MKTLKTTSGIELIKKKLPDLIFCDVTLSDINGFQVLKKISIRCFIRCHLSTDDPEAAIHLPEDG